MNLMDKNTRALKALSCRITIAAAANVSRADNHLTSNNIIRYTISKLHHDTIAVYKAGLRSPAITSSAFNFEDRTAKRPQNELMRQDVKTTRSIIEVTGRRRCIWSRRVAQLTEKRSGLRIIYVGGHCSLYWPSKAQHKLCIGQERCLDRQKLYLETGPRRK